MPDSLKYLIDALAKLPWVGEKTAMKLAFFILTKKKELMLELAEKLTSVYKNIDMCPVCWALKDVWDTLCNYCNNDKREKNILCVIEEYADLLAIEQTGVYKGLYHVLGGSLSPLHGRGPKDLTFDLLFSRLTEVNEIIIATNPNFEWEATALYLRDHLPKNIRTTRLSRGLPNAGYIDYVDSLTLMNALKGRQEYS